MSAHCAAPECAAATQGKSARPPSTSVTFSARWSTLCRSCAAVSPHCATQRRAPRRWRCCRRRRRYLLTVSARLAEYWWNRLSISTWKRRAWCGVVEEMQFSFTPGVLKSPWVLPNAMTGTRQFLRSATSSSPFIAQLAEGDGFPLRLISTTEPSVTRNLETVVDWAWAR